MGDNAWYLSSLERLADLGVVEPYEDGTFRPSEPVTRLDMAVFMSRAFSSIGEVAEPAGVFGDVPADSEYAGVVEGILAAGVTDGCSPDPLLYCPDRPVRRDQMASFFARALKKQNARGEHDQLGKCKYLARAALVRPGTQSRGPDPCSDAAGSVGRNRVFPTPGRPGSLWALAVENRVALLPTRVPSFLINQKLELEGLP